MNKDIQTRYKEIFHHKISHTNITPPKGTPPAIASPLAPNACVLEHDQPVAYFTGVNVANHEYLYYIDTRPDNGVDPRPEGSPHP